MTRTIANPVSHAQHSRIMDPSIPCSGSPHLTECPNCKWSAWVEPHSTALGDKVLAHHFTVKIRKGCFTYKVNPGMKKAAETIWWRHGVCVHCNHRAISCGLCLRCGHDYREPERVNPIKLIKMDNGAWRTNFVDSNLNNYRHSAYESATLDAFPNGATEVEIPAYKDITDRLEIQAYTALLREWDCALVAKVNDLEEFTLWASRMAESAMIGALDLNRDKECDWFNVYCYHPKYRQERDNGRAEYHPFIRRICKKVWEEYRNGKS